MGLFGRGKGGGIMNVIRCDQENYLVWKWRPKDQDVNSTSRENAIRWGSSLRVKDGEVAVFVYKQKDGTVQDFIEGPFDETLKTANLPIIANIVNSLYGGEAPFQAEVYFINLQQNNQIRFGVPYFDVFDPRLPDFGVPLAVRGTITFNISDYKGFIKKNRLINFDLAKLQEQVKSMVNNEVKSTVMGIPAALGIPVVQLESRINDVSQRLSDKMGYQFEDDFGVNLKRFDVSAIEIDKESVGYKQLRALTAGITEQTMQAQAELNIKNMQDTQRINAANMEESLRIQREESQRAQRLQSETNFIGAHAIDQQTEVLKAAAQSLGSMGAMGGGEGGGGGMNAAGMMTGMMMGGAMGQQMAGMMGNMGQQMQNAMQTPPPMSSVAIFVAVNGQQTGPFNMPQLQQMAAAGQLTAQSLVWKQGMAQWAAAGTVPELAALFAPPVPGGGVPPVPGSMPPPLG